MLTLQRTPMASGDDGCCETNGWKWPIFALRYLFALAYLAAGNHCSTMCTLPEPVRVLAGPRRSIARRQVASVDDEGVHRS